MAPNSTRESNSTTKPAHTHPALCPITSPCCPHPSPQWENSRCPKTGFGNGCTPETPPFVVISQLPGQHEGGRQHLCLQLPRAPSASPGACRLICKYSAGAHSILTARAAQGGAGPPWRMLSPDGGSRTPERHKTHGPGSGSAHPPCWGEDEEGEKRAEASHSELCSEHNRGVGLEAAVPAPPVPATLGCGNARILKCGPSTQKTL